MAKRNYLNVRHGDFHLSMPDAKQTAQNIERIFIARTRWFSLSKPMAREELLREYHQTCPQMAQMFPGIVEQMLQPEILRQLGFPVTADDQVHWSAEK